MSGDPKPVGGDVVDLMDFVKRQLDTDWEAREARVARERELEHARTASLLKPVDLTERGWPRRAVDAAKRADMTRSAVARLLAWDFEARCIVVLSGQPGCGKTVAAARWAMDRSPGAMFLRSATFATGSRYDADARARWLDAPALVLDDLGAEFLDAKGSFLVDLDELIDTYYGDARPLVITTNSDAPTFKARYGERIVDRLRECGAWLSIADASMRRAP